MTTRRLLIAALVGIVSYAALVLLATRLNPVREWNVRHDRGATIEATRAAAGRFDLDATKWQVYLDAEYDARRDYYLRAHGRPASDAARLSPSLTRALFTEPDGEKRRLRIEMTPDGRLTSVERSAGGARGNSASMTADDRERGSGDDDDEDEVVVKVQLGEQAPKQDTPGAGGATHPNARVVADDAIRRLIGADESQRFAFVSAEADKIGDERGTRFRYERKSGGDTPELKTIASCFVAADGWREAALSPEFDSSFERAYDARTNRIAILRSTVGFGLTIAVLILIVLYFRAQLRGRIRHKPALVLFAIIFVCAFAGGMIDNAIDDSFIDHWRSETRTGAIVDAVVENTVPPLFVALGFALVWSVGFVFARRSVPLKVASFAALLRGKLSTRFVGASVACGVFAGGVLALVPYLFLWSGITPGFEIARPADEIFVTRSPVLSAGIQLPGFALFSIFACLVPALHRFARLRRFIMPIVLAACALIFVNDPSRFAAVSGVIAVACLVSIVAYDIFRFYDLLALVLASVSVSAATSAVALLATDSPALRSSGWIALGSLGAVALAGTGIHFFGKTARIEDEIQLDPSDELTGTRQAERERLRAEFGVARQAQERMLPRHAPRIPGYDIAASCKPAREVGGDLYDFIKLPDERIGIVVADVSGKGVPAALYMTLTKGLLASIAEVESDPRRMLCEANKHLFQVCRRKTFVTLILGVLDPPTGELTLARAGHNPTVWRRAAKGEVRLLQSPGLGLGLNKGALFDKTLKTETIRLDAGDAVVFYSDGVTEAMNVDREEYGEDRLQDIVSRTDGMSAGRTEQAILADVHGFLGDEAPQDDVTVVVLRVAEDRVRG